VIYIHDLDGCAPVPLAHYMKALGVLRLVAEQADPEARGWWEGERFRFATSLSADELLRFFIEACAPPPVFNPWGGRSGFYAGSSETGARKALKAIEESADARLTGYREAIRGVRELIAELYSGKKPADDEKARFIAELRKRVRGPAVKWLDCVVALLSSKDGELDSVYPALFGTGGNEGSGSYTSAYMSAVVECVVQRRHGDALRAALLGEPMPRFDSGQNMLQFLPEGAASPWDLLLCVAGALLVRSAVASRGEAGAARWMASPFYVAATSFGYPSGCRADEYFLKQGKEMPGRGEQWFPLWSQPASLNEVAQLFAEGRASNRRPAADGWSMARAVATLGVRRGIAAFQRYGYLQRDNQSLHFAVSLGRYDVPDQMSPLQRCLDDLDDWLPRLHRLAKNKDAPARLESVHRRLMTQLFDLLERTGEPRRWQGVLLALGEVEAVMKSGSGFTAQPVPPLRPEWVRAADDDSPEFRLALACALQARAFGRGDGRPVDPIRRHWLALDETRRLPRFATSGDATRVRLDARVDVVMQGRSGIDDAIAVVERRLVEASREGMRGFPLRAAARAGACLADLTAWLEGRVDADRTLALARALMALDRELWAEQIVPILPPPAGTELPDDAWLCIRLAHLPSKLPDGREIPCDPAISRRLASGDAAGAVALALRRLRAVNLRAAVRASSVPPYIARLWAAALVFPVSAAIAERLVRRLDPSFNPEPSA
jgi:CRISPR-associated protein Csx17